MSLSLNYPAIQPSLNLDFANTDRLDPRVTFTRASPATYYDGVTTAKAEENLFRYSEQFNDGYWRKASSSITADSTTAPNGTTTADTLTGNDASIAFVDIASASNRPTTLNVPYTLSVYARANTKSWLWLEIFDVANQIAYFDLTNGVVGSVPVGVTASIQSVGNNWYRCIYTYTPTTTQVVANIGVAQANNTRTLSGSGSIFIWGAQLEQRSSATAYTVTTAQPVTNYIPVLLAAAANVPRFEHNPITGVSLGLEVEEARTNLALYSQEFNNAYWTKDNSSIIANTVVAPDGTLTGDLFFPTTSGSIGGLARSLYRAFTVTAGVTYTTSVYVKFAGFQWIRMVGISADALLDECWFDVLNGVLGTTGAANTVSVSNAGNGWYRLQVTNTVAAVPTGYFWISCADANNSQTVTANNWNGVYVWGAQVEVGAFPTSYIATVAATQTRQADLASMTGTNFSSWYNNAEGTIYVEVGQFTGPPGLNGSFGLVNIGSGSIANTIDIYQSSTASITFEIITGGVIQSTFIPARNNQVAGAYKTNDVNFGFGGAVGTTDTSAIIPVVNQMNIGRVYTSGGFVFSGTIKKIAYYPIRLTNAQLQNLTK